MASELVLPVVVNDKLITDYDFNTWL